MSDRMLRTSYLIGPAGEYTAEMEAAQCQIENILPERIPIVELASHNHDEIREWTEKHLSGVWQYWYSRLAKKHCYFFEHTEDAVMFKLRFG